ncbi:MAG: beta-ketoacyl synthase, partial [Burkholderiales bacterium]
VAGWDLAVDGASPTGPQRDGAALAAVLERALARAGCGAEGIGAVKLHAAGSGDADAAEAAALLRVFGQCLPPLVSFKPYLGHTLGASGALETALLLGCLAQHALPATPGFTHLDPALGMAPTLARQPCAADLVLLNFIGFGGSLAALVLERE